MAPLARPSATRSSAPTRPDASTRLPRRPTGRLERRRELRSALLAVLGLLVVLVGVPAALVLIVGNPLPTTAPSREWLTAQVSATTVLRVLSCALWLAWAHFAVCVLAEWRAARSGRGVPTDVPLGGGSQFAARRLVAAALLLAGAATLVPSAVSAPPAPPAPVSASAQQVVPVTTAVLAVADVAVPATGVAGPNKTYVVQPPDGRRYDSLWDIAERTLGDPFRYAEVFALNRDRVQDDGRKLVDANLIHPGWVLVMPADASGPGVGVPALAPPVSAPALSGAPVAPPAADPGAPTAFATGASTVAPSASTVAPSGSSVAPGASGAAAPGTSASTALLGGGLLAAGVLVALSARRGPYVRPSEGGAEQQLRLAAAPGRAALLDRALRGLAEACATTGRSLPEIAVAYADDAHVTLSLVGAAGAPPAPWTDVSDGRGWTVLACDLPATAPDVAAPYPALAGVALSGGTDVLVDLEAAPGLVSLEGDASVARDIATSLVVELSTNLWSDGVRVTAVGFGDDLTAAAPGTVTVSDTLDAVLPGLEAEARAAAGSRLGASGVLAGRLVRDAARLPPRVVVLSGPPTPEQAQRLHALVAEVRTPLAVVCVGATTAARWRFTADRDGTLDLGVLGLRAQARRLPPADYLPLLEALRAADHLRATVGSGIAALTPRAALQEVTGAGSGAAAAAPDDATAAQVRVPRGSTAVAVRLLGPVEVQAPGQVDPAARALLTELVVAVALPADGLHEAVLRAEVWPRGVGDDVVAATVAQAQAWLGDAADGRPRLRPGPDGRWVLAEDVHSDWDLMRACAAATGPDEATDLEQALAQIRGAAFTTAGQRSASLGFHRAARDARVIGTAVARRAAALAVARSDADAAERSLRAGLLLVPTAEPLWRDLLRLVAATAGGSAPQVADEALSTLAAHGLRPEPETDALIAQLAPGVARVTG